MPEVAPASAPEWARRTVRVQPVSSNELHTPSDGSPIRVIGLIPSQIVTESLVETPTVREGLAVADADRDLAKIAVVERHLGSGRIGLGFARGFGLPRGAIASTVAHDAHNIVCVGMDDGDMARAVGRLTELGGGMVVVDARGVRAELPLAIAGLVSDQPLAMVLDQSRLLSDAVRALGCEIEAPFHAMGFLALSVIPALKITDRGLVDVERFELVPLEA